jgi:hypothetical protein
LLVEESACHFSNKIFAGRGTNQSGTRLRPVITVIIQKMTDQNYDDANSAVEGTMLRLSLAAFAMIALGIALWEWTEGPATASTRPPLTMASQTR